MLDSACCVRSVQELGLLLAQTPEVGYVVVEATGVGQPAPIAAALASTDSRGRSLLVRSPDAMHKCCSWVSLKAAHCFFAKPG